MIELHLDLKFMMKPWKKALAFSFLFYLIVLFILIVIITFMKKDFDFGLVSKISAVYLTALILCYRYMYRIFKKKFTSLITHG
ncbi:UPI0003D1C28A related cluster [groundwater metagenome]